MLLRARLFLFPLACATLAGVCWEPRYRFVTQFFRVLRAARLQLYALVLGHYSHLLSTAPPSSRARTVDAWEVRGIWTQSCMHFILQTWHENYDQLDVYWWTAAGSWFLLDETFAVVLTNGNTVADRCSFYCTTVAFAGALSTSWPSTRRTWHWPTGVRHHVVVAVAITALFLAVDSRRGSRQRRQPSRTSPFSVPRTSAELLLVTSLQANRFLFTFLVFCLSGTL